LFGAGRELFDVIRRHILELGEDRARLRPFAVLAESDFTGHGLKTVPVHVIRERILIEATRCLDGLRQNLSGGIAERLFSMITGIAAATMLVA
jgi:hypothetical protein